MHGIGPWDVRITIDLFLGGLGVGVFLFALLLSFYNKEHYFKLIKISMYLAPVLVGTGLLFLISELGRPERFITTMFRVNPQSITSWGGFIQSIFMIISLTIAVMYFKNKAVGKTFNLFQLFGGIFAIGVGVYHGLLLSSLGRALWSGGLIPLLFLVSSLLGGMVIVLLLKAFFAPVFVSKNVQAEVAAANSSDKQINFTLLLFLLTGIQIVLIFIWQITVYRATAETIETMNYLMEQYGAIWWALVVLIGLIVPFAGAIFQLLKDYKSELPNSLAVLFALMVITGGFAFKYIILLVGQYNVQFFL